MVEFSAANVFIDFLRLVYRHHYFTISNMQAKILSNRSYDFSYQSDTYEKIFRPIKLTE